MKRTLLIIVAVLTAGVLGLAALATRETVLHWAFARATAALAPGELRVEALHGNLLGPIRARGLVYRDARIELHIGELLLDWRPGALLRGTLQVTQLHLDDTQLRLRPAPAATAPAPWALPLAVELDDARITGGVVTVEGNAPVSLARVELRGSGRDTRLALTRLAIEAERYSVTAAGRLDLAPPYPLDLTTDWSVRAAPFAPLAGRGWLRGDSERLATEQQLAAPWTATLTGTASDVLEATQWTATLATAELDPAAWHSGWPTAALHARLEARGDRHTLNAQGRIALSHAGRTFDGELRLAAAAEGLRLDQLTVRERGGDAMLDVAGSWQPDTATPLALHTRWQTLRWPLAGEPWVRSPQGSLDLRGRLDRYRFELAGVVEPARLGPITVRGRGAGDRNGLGLAAADGQWLKGQLNASGRVDWAPALRWQAQLTGRDLDPGVLHADWPGRLALRATSHGCYRERLDGALTIEELAGTLRNRPWHLSGGLRVAADQYALEGVELRAGKARLAATGQVDRHWAFDWQLAAPDLADLLPQASGSVQASGRLRGPRARPAVSAQIGARAVAWRDRRVTALDGAIELDLADQAESRVDLRAEGLRVPGVAVDHVELNGQGRLRDHRLQAAVRRADAQLRLAATGALQERHWRGTLVAGEFATARLGAWRQREPAALEVGADSFALARLCLDQDGHHACVDAARRAARGGQFRAELAGVPLAIFEPWLMPGTRVDGRVTGDLSLTVAADDGLDGTVALAAGAGALQLGAGGEAGSAIAFDSLALQARAAADRLEATAAVELADAGRADAELAMPFAPFKPAPAGARALRGSLHARLDELGMLTMLWPQLLQPRGRLRLDAALAGTVDAPELRGEARLEQGSAGIAGLGITLKDVQASARSGDAHRIAVEGTARSGSGPLRVDGTVELAGEVPWRVDLRLRGQDFEAIHLPEYVLVGSPDLRLRAQPRAVALDGSVEVARATIAPRTLRTGGQLSPDVVVRGAGTETRTERVAVTADVRVRLSRQVRVNTYNVNALVEGDVTVHDRPGVPTTASGELKVVRGTYRAYGKDLEIDRGRLTFTGGPVDDPEVDLRAVRRVENVTAGIQARGRLRNPEVTLFSEPALDQTNILSYIVFGTSAQQTGGTENAWLGQAVSALTLAGGEQLAQSVGGAVGIEDVRIASDASGGTSVMLGSYLSPRLYVSYGIGLFQTGNSLRLRYDIDEHWQIQTDTGAYTGADVLYKIER